ncbi:protein brambleberry-like isoform X2 [Artemia franciscana]|uniref:protein brambleberry-like isoform X2 n=1 Tax=Artemia franciscana TaxID=6661 RepID=UPI0032D9C442
MKLLLLVLFFLLVPSNGQILKWILGLTNDEVPEKPKEIHKVEAIDLSNAALPNSHLSYESPMESEDAFLTEAKKFLASQKDLTPLDLCFHKVVIQLQERCDRMNEDELSRFSIALLNCQAGYEGRKTYLCTADMTLRECTGSMDGDAWNAYQLFKTRARGVCTLLRQQQFKLQAEIAVNKLMMAAKQQLDGLAELSTQTEQLEQNIGDTLNTVIDGNDKLLQQHDSLVSAHELMAGKITGNLEQLAEEKALIAAGHNEVAAILGKLKSRIDETLQELCVQSQAQQSNHQEIIADLRNLDDTITSIQEHLSSSLSDVLNQQITSSKIQRDSLESLTVINDTLKHLSNLSLKTKTQLDWIESYLTYTGSNIQTIKSWALHSGYLIGGMISTSFLQAPWITRLALILILPINLSAELAQNRSMNWKSLLVVLFAVTFSYSLLKLLFRVLEGSRKSLKKRIDETSQTSAPDLSPRHFFRSRDLPLRRPSIHDYDNIAHSTFLDNSHEVLVSGSFHPSSVQGGRKASGLYPFPCEFTSIHPESETQFHLWTFCRRVLAKRASLIAELNA